MLDSTDICQLYDSVLDEEIAANGIPPSRVRKGINRMGHAYSKKTLKLTSIQCAAPLNFNDPAVRCAYLHKNAGLHTYVVQDVMLGILRDRGCLFLDIINSDWFNLCCLGGGPGTDVVGVIAALSVAFRSFKPSSVTVIDCKRGWESTFASLIQKLRFGRRGNIWNFQWRYVEADLLQGMTYEAGIYIASASVVTMIKFVSACACTKADIMLENIFEAMKPGALVLYVDNAAGGYTEVVERASKRYGFEYVVPARRHALYENESFRIERFGHTSCFKTIVTVLLLRKPYFHNLNKRIAATQPNLPKSSNTYKFPDNWYPMVAETDSNSYNVPLHQRNLNLNLRENNSISRNFLINEDNLNRAVRINAISADIDKNRQSGNNSCSPTSVKLSRLMSSSPPRVSSPPPGDNSSPSRDYPSAYRVSSSPTPVNSLPSFTPHTQSATPRQVQPISYFPDHTSLGDDQSWESVSDVDNNICLCCVIS